MSVTPGNDPFSGTNTKNLLQHIISPKIVDTGFGSYVVKTDLINIDNVYITGNIVGPSGPVTFGATGATGPSGASGLPGSNGTLPVPSPYFFSSFTSDPSTALKTSGTTGSFSSYISTIPLLPGKWYLISGTMTINPGSAFTTSSNLTTIISDDGTVGGNNFPLQTILATSSTSINPIYIPVCGIFKTNSDASYLKITFNVGVAESAYSNSATTAIIGNFETLLLS